MRNDSLVSRLMKQAIEDYLNDPNVSDKVSSFYEMCNEAHLLTGDPHDVLVTKK